MVKRSIPAHPKEKTTDLPRLRADAKFQKLTPAQQDVLVDYCHGDFPTSAAEREDDAVMMCGTLFEVEPAVRETILGLCKPGSRVLRRLLGFSANGSFRAPLLDGKALSGGDRDAAQQRLAQLMAYLARHEDSAQGQGRQALITNTIEWFILLGLPIEHTETIPAIGAYDHVKHLVQINAQEIRLTAAGVGETTETVRVIAHEVNHACRRSADRSRETSMVDELYGYVTGLLAGGQSVTREQVASTFTLLEGPPYSLKDVIRSQVGVDYQKAIKYSDHGTYELLVYPLPSPGTANTGWHHTNALPGF